MNFPTAEANNTETRLELEGKLADYEMRSVHSDGSITYAWNDRTLHINARGQVVPLSERGRRS